MNRFRITTDIDATVLIGKLSHDILAPSRVTYSELQKLFESEQSYFSISSPLKIELATLKEGIKTEFIVNLYENIDENALKVDAFKVILPMDGTAYISKDGRVWVKRSMRLYVVGKNPKMSTLEFNNEIEKRTKEYLKGTVAGISPECIYSYIIPGIN